MSKYSGLEQFPRGAEPEPRRLIVKAAGLVLLGAVMAALVHEASNDSYTGAPIPEDILEIDRAVDNAKNFNAELESK